jgi:hypothetical protein
MHLFCELGLCGFVWVALARLNFLSQLESDSSGVD